ncbi:MAG: GerMN domain-containing protein [Clostridiales bacterium]|nr:GerMN domain-containing protein [Clostridiales bacterium]
MKKIVVCLMLTLALCVLTQPQIRRSLWQAVRTGLEEAAQGSEAAPTATQEPDFSHLLGTRPANDTMNVTLYFRYRQTELLGAQSMALDITRDQTVARSIVEELVAGPDTLHGQLTALFPKGTQVLSVTGEGTTAFVTLSRAFLGAPDGAPQDWEDLESWQEEAALRRRLAVQSLVLSLTEGGRYQRVQLMIAQTDDDAPERVPLYCFDREQTNPSVVLGACSRDEAVLLTPQRAMALILEGWQARDWAQVYQLLTPESGGQLLTLSDFEAQMRRADVSLLDYTISQGTVSLDGRTATVVLDASLRSTTGGDAQIVRESVALVRSADNWAMTPSTLESLVIRD